jgi:hypothetical protein
MTHSEEIALHNRDRGAWIAYVSPGMARSLMLLDDAGINRTWPLMSRDYQAAVWNHLSADERKRVERARGRA